MSTKKRYFFLVGIVIVNIILKIIYANYAPFSYDEIISVKDTLLDFGHIKHEAEWDNNPPFFYYCLWVWHKIIPVSELNSRLLSVIFVSLSIGLSFLFAQKYYDNKTAFFSAVLLSLSNFITFYAQETRTYSLVLLLTLLSSLQFFKYINKSSYVNILLLSLINFLLIYSHYISGMVVVIQYIIIIVFHKPKITPFILIQTVFIASLVFLRFTKKQFLNIINYNNKSDFWLKTATFQDLKQAASELFFNHYSAVIIVFVLIIFCFYSVKNRKQRDADVRFYCLSIGFFSILFLYALGTFKALFLARYVIFCIPFAVMIVSYQLTRFNAAGYLILAGLIGYQFLSLNLKKENKTDYRELAKIIKANKNSEDHVIINTRDNLLLFEYYYNRENFLKYKSVDSICQTENIYGLNDLEFLKDLNFNSHANVFLIQSFHKINSNDNTFDTYLSERLKKSYHRDIDGGSEFNIYRNK